MARFIKLTEYSGRAIHIAPDCISVIEGESVGPSGVSDCFSRAKIHTTNWGRSVRETPEQILALIEGRTPSSEGEGA